MTRFVPSCVAVTLTPGTTAPEASLTTPSSRAVVTCACPLCTEIKSIAIKAPATTWLPSGTRRLLLVPSIEASFCKRLMTVDFLCAQYSFREFDPQLKTSTPLIHRLHFVNQLASITKVGVEPQSFFEAAQCGVVFPELG